MGWMEGWKEWSICIAWYPLAPHPNIFPCPSFPKCIEESPWASRSRGLCVSPYPESLPSSVATLYYIHCVWDFHCLWSWDRTWAVVLRQWTMEPFLVFTEWTNTLRTMVGKLGRLGEEIFHSWFSWRNERTGDPRVFWIFHTGNAKFCTASNRKGRLDYTTRNPLQ